MGQVADRDGGYLLEILGTENFHLVQAADGDIGKMALGVRTKFT